jgi:amidase
VAAGLTQWAIGSETDGSIVCPASLNGCVGIKPTVGAIPRDGVIPISPSQDSPGPLAQTVLQAALLLDVLTQKSEYVVAAGSQQGIKIGVVREWMTKNAVVNDRFEESIRRLEKQGIHFIEVELSPPEDIEHDDELTVLLYELGEGMRAYLSTRPGARVSSLKEIVAFNNQNPEQELQHFGQDLFEKALGLGNNKIEYLESRKRNRLWAEKTLELGLKDVDVLIGCTYAPAWESSLLTGDYYETSNWITTAPAIAGTPIGTIPMGLISGLPVGLGFVSARNQEAKLITAMAKAEHALDLGILKPTFLK